MNNFTGAGRITKDAVMRNFKTKDGTLVPVTEFTVACNQLGKTGKKYTSYVRVSFYRNYADAMNPYLKQGRIVTINGPVEAKAYIGKDGKAYSYLEMKLCNSFEFMDKKPTDAGIAAEHVIVDEIPEEALADEVDEAELPW